MKSYKQYITEMSDEVNKFGEIRRKIKASRNYEQLKIVCNLFISYNELYGDKELAKRLQKIVNAECDIKRFIFERAKKKIIKLFNWYNKQRSSPRDIKENNIEKIADSLLL